MENCLNFNMKLRETERREGFEASLFLASWKIGAKSLVSALLLRHQRKFKWTRGLNENATLPLRARFSLSLSWGFPPLNAPFRAMMRVPRLLVRVIRRRRRFRRWKSAVIRTARIWKSWSTASDFRKTRPEISKKALLPLIRIAPVSATS
ncbi:hypothetical protein AGR1A_Cc60239 [Agrobacterium fabacearum CFBP 5771]|nr:hypothetical protein AGR1A_Cc60239 [Agrobacterium fabacearum CFBP 5771]